MFYKHCTQDENIDYEEGDERGEVHEVEEEDDEKEDEEEDEEVEEEEEVQWHRSSSASGFSFYYDPWSLHACLATRQ